MNQSKTLNINNLNYEKNDVKVNKNIQGRISTMSAKNSSITNDSLNQFNVNNQYTKKPRQFSVDRSDNILNENYRDVKDKDRESSNIRERSNDNFAL